ncbi:MAG: RsmB/NOP family class I SAM-dependent RNA methyltransferase [Sulfolobales archaeon]
MVLRIAFNEIFRELRDRIKITDRVREIAKSYGYLPYMVARYIDMLGEEEALELLRVFERKDLFKPAIRCNDLKHSCEKTISSLERIGFEFEKIAWSSHAYKIIKSPDKPTAGSTHEYLKGYYYLYRDAASLIPPLLLAPRENETILDSCAAPGGKTVHILLLIRDRGLVIANDLSRLRLAALRYNLERMSFKSYIVTRFDARRTHEYFREEFGKILVDTPCSAEGAIMFDPSRKSKTSYETLAKLVSREIEILSSNIEALSPGGLLVYSTCSIAPEENEYVISKIIDHYRESVETVNVNSLWSKGLSGFLGLEFSPDVEKCVRIWPHKHLMEGYFVCVLRRK